MSIPGSQDASHFSVRQSPCDCASIVAPNFVQVLEFFQVEQHSHLVESRQFLTQGEGRQRHHVEAHCAEVFFEPDSTHFVKLCVKDNILPCPCQSRHRVGDHLVIVVICQSRLFGRMDREKR